MNWLALILGLGKLAQSLADWRGRAGEATVGQPVLVYVVGQDRSDLVEQHRLLVAGAIDQLVMELRFTRQDGRVVWCRVHSAAVRSRDESLRYTVSHVEDATTMKQRAIAPGS